MSISLNDVLELLISGSGLALETIPKEGSLHGTIVAREDTKASTHEAELELGGSRLKAEMSTFDVGSQSGLTRLAADEYKC